MKWAGYAMLLALSFALGRYRPSAKTAEASSRPMTPSQARARATYAALSTRLAQTAPRSERETRLLATVEPPPAALDAWRGRLDRRYEEMLAHHAPPLSDEKRAAMFAGNERVMREHRQVRAAFLLGQISEAAYIAALERSVSANIEAAERLLTREELRVYYDVEPGGDFFNAADRPSLRGTLSQVRYAECKQKQGTPVEEEAP
jgi:hypothetical protein